MRFNHVFGFLLILLAIWLGINASDRQDVDDGTFADGDTADADTTADEPDRDAGDAERADHKDSKDRQDDVDGNEGIVSNGDFCANVSEDSRFTDLGRNHDEAVRCMDEADVVTGVSDDTFAPQDAITRGQTAATIAAMIRVSNDLEAPDADLRSLPDASDPRFPDTRSDHPHAEEVAQLNEAGIISGYVDARYEPTRRVSRAQMASMLDRAYRYLNHDALPSSGDQFSDDDDSVHEDSINALASADIMEGISGTRFGPNRSVSRGQMATYVARMMSRMEREGRITPLP